MKRVHGNKNMGYSTSLSVVGIFSFYFHVFALQVAHSKFIALPRGSLSQGHRGTHSHVEQGW